MFPSSALKLEVIASSQRGVTSEVLGAFTLAVTELAGTCWLSIGMFGVSFAYSIHLPLMVLRSVLLQLMGLMLLQIMMVRLGLSIDLSDRLIGPSCISIRSSPNIPLEIHFALSRQPSHAKGIPVPQSLSFAHSTIVLLPVFSTSNCNRSLFCENFSLYSWSTDFLCCCFP